MSAWYVHNHHREIRMALRMHCPLAKIVEGQQRGSGGEDDGDPDFVNRRKCLKKH